MSTDILYVIPESTMALDSNLTQTEPKSAQAIPWSQLFNRPKAVIEVCLKNAVVEVGRSRAVSGLLTQTKSILSVAKSIATTFVPRTISGQSPAQCVSSLDAIFIDLEAGIVQSYEEEGEEGQLNQDPYATLPRATLPFNTVCFIASTRDKSLNTIVDLEAGIVQSDEKEGKEGPLNQDRYATPPPGTISFTTIISLTSTHKKSVNKNVDPKKARKTSRGPGVKLQGNWGNTKHIAPNFLKRNSTISGLDEGHKGQRNEQKAKKAKKAHESRFDLDEVLMDAPASLPDMAAYFPNLSSKRRWQSMEARQVAEKQAKRAKRCLHTKDIEDDVMMDVNPAESRIPAVASPAPPKATNTSLKRGVGTPKAKEGTISSKMAKKPKQKHEGKLPIDVCVEFEDITQLVDARMREKEERRQEERVRREAPRILKRSQGRAAAEAAEEADKSAKRPKTAKDAEEAKTPELRRAFKRARGSDEKAEKPKKKLKS